MFCFTRALNSQITAVYFQYKNVTLLIDSRGFTGFQVGKYLLFIIKFSFAFFSGLVKVKSVFLIFLCDFLLDKDHWLQMGTLKKKDVTFKKEKKSTVHSIISQDEPMTKKDNFWICSAASIVVLQNMMEIVLRPFSKKCSYKESYLNFTLKQSYRIYRNKWCSVSLCDLQKCFAKQFNVSC